MQSKNVDKVKVIQESARELQRATQETSCAERRYHSRSMAKAFTQIKGQKSELDVETAAKRLLTLSCDSLNKRCSGTTTTAAARLEKMKEKDDQITGYSQDLEGSREDMGRLQQTLEAGLILCRQLEPKLEATVANQQEAESVLQEEVAAGKEALQEAVAAGKGALEEAVVAGKEAVEVRTLL